MLHRLFQLWIMVAAVIPAGSPDRYFKEDHLTGADYIRLTDDGRYTITGREHMGVGVYESGRWEKKGNAITFVPAEAGKPSYKGLEVTHKTHTFLTFDTEAAPSIVISDEEIRRRLDSKPGALPEYVFFEIGKKVYEEETKVTYPFRSRRRASLSRDACSLQRSELPADTRLHPTAAGERTR